MIKEEIRRTLDLEAGGQLKDARIVFHTSGVRKGKVIWICHALTANSDPQDWWPEMVGPGKTIDTEKNLVVCVNMLGSAYGSESPASINSASGKPWLLDFPKVTIRDSVTAFIEVRKHLKINKIDLLIGASNGGFHAIEWAITEPDLFKRCLFLCTAPRISPFLGATVEAQRMALEADPSFREARDLTGGTEGLKCARAQALISYRCFKGYGLTQAEPDPDTLFAGRVASYERYQGEKLVRRGFDAYSYFSLCNSLDSHNAGRGRGGVQKALQRIKASCTVLAVDTDALFPPEEGRQWTFWIPGAQLIEISSNFGHDGFLLETAKLSAIILR
ncbi:MAG: alpha/beta fold hydrolase [Bacteroidales bacterium]|nr:alpha/beta fold hydrolase [Bacteroidales bacterium]